MADTTITSANSVATLTARKAGVLGATLEGYSVDRAIFSDAIQVAEVQMGVDGRMTAGYTPMPQPVTMTFQADSPSLRQVIKPIVQTMKSTREIVWVTMEVALPGPGEKYAFVRGTITNAKQMPDLGKVLQPVDVQFTFQSVDASLL